MISPRAAARGTLVHIGRRQPAPVRPSPAPREREGPGPKGWEGEGLAASPSPRSPPPAPLPPGGGGGASFPYAGAEPPCPRVHVLWRLWACRGVGGDAAQLGHD